MKNLKMFCITTLLFFASPGFANTQMDEQYRCKITDFNKNVLLDDVMTISGELASPAQHLKVNVNAKASDGSRRTLAIAVWMSRPFTPDMIGLSFGVRDVNGSQDRRMWIQGPSVATYIANLTRMNLFLKGVIPLDQGRVVHINYTVDCKLQK